MSKYKHFITIITLFMVTLITACGSPPLAQPEGVVPVKQAETALPTVENIENTPNATPTVIANETSEATIEATPVPIVTPKQAETDVKEIAPSIPDSPVRVGNYEFSQPQRILSGQAVHLIDWLPDSQQLLVGRYNYDGEGREFIEIIDLNGQQIASFGAWYISPLDAIILSPDETTITFIGYDEETELSALMTVDTNLSATIIEAEVNTLVTSPDNTNLWAINKDQQIIQSSTVASTLKENLTTSSLALASTIAKNSENQEGGYNVLSIAVNPTNPNQAIIFDRFNFLLVDLRTGKLTAIELGEEQSQRATGKYWTLEVQWSPDGQSIAAKTTVGRPLTGFSNLTILDTSTWEYRRVEKLDIFSGGMRWLPNSKDMLIRVDNNNFAGWGVGNIHLFSIESLESQPLPLFSEPLVHSVESNMLISPDSKKFITSCVLLSEMNFNDPSKTTYQSCLIDIDVHP